MNRGWPDHADGGGGSVPAAATVTVRLRYRGDTLVKGFPPGVDQPPWLAITDRGATDSSADVELDVNEMSVVGDQSTKVRFAVSHVNSTAVDVYDLPVTYRVAASDLFVQPAPTALSFLAIGAGPTPPARSASVAFNGASVMVLTAPSWLSLSPPADPSTSPASFTVSVNSTAFAPGTTLSGDIVFATRRDQLRRVAPVHVDYRVVSVADLQLQFIAPYIATAGRAGTAHIRGHGFLGLGGPVTVGLGDLGIGPVVPDSDTQITVSYPALPSCSPVARGRRSPRTCFRS